RETTKVLTRLSRYTTLLVLPSADNARLRHVDLVRLRDTAVLLILVTADGKVQNRLLEWPPGLSDNLDALANRVNELVAGRTLDEASDALSQNLTAHEVELAALQAVLAGLRRADEPEVHVDGTAHLLEAANLERTRDLLALLEEGSRVKQVLQEAARAPGIRIFIGEENPSAALYERGLVTAPVGPGGTLGVLGVIGPRHLDYARVVPLVDLTAQVVTRTLQG
ncbi:MAG TPA: HrcA family transcriptional regulator, partial [Myxococcota bacterium]